MKTVSLNMTQKQPQPRKRTVDEVIDIFAGLLLDKFYDDMKKGIKRKPAKKK